MNFLQILAIVAPVFVMIASGAGLRVLGWLKPEADSSLLKIGVNLLYPALIADTILGNALLARATDLGGPPAIGFLLIVCSLGISALVLWPLKLPSHTMRAGLVSTGMQNYGYLVIPLVEALYDRETLGVLFMHNLGVELAMWSLVVWILSSGHGGGFWRHLLNVPVIAILASGALNLINANIWLPVFLRKSLHNMGQAAIPIALILTGATLYDLFRQRSEEPISFPGLTLAMMTRLLLLPAIVLGLAKLLPLSEPLKRILVLQAAMPSAMMPAVLCKHYKSDARFSLQIILLSTLIGLVTIPLWIRIGLPFIAK